MRLKDFIRDASLFESVMDVGCGVGEWTRYITSRRIIGVDAHLRTLQVAADRCPHATFVCCDMRELHKVFPRNCVECVVAMDSIEHLERDDALKSLGGFELIARTRVMLFVPVGEHPQVGDATHLGNEHWQQHRSTWYPDDFRELGYTVLELPDFHRGTPGKDPRALIAVKNLNS